MSLDFDAAKLLAYIYISCRQKYEVLLCIQICSYNLYEIRRANMNVFVENMVGIG